MIDTALFLLQSELQNFINKVDLSTPNVAIGNIGMLETTTPSNIDNSIVITLVNVEEESSLKNQPAVKRPFANNAVYQNPPVYLNLYVLFTCNFSGTDTKVYSDALKRLGYIIQFLQSKNLFAASSSSSLPDKADFDITKTDVANLKFTMELYTLTFEQINHLWGSLGGRQVPFVMYKLRLVAITNRSILREVPLIEEVDTNLEPITNN